MTVVRHTHIAGNVAEQFNTKRVSLHIIVKYNHLQSMAHRRRRILLYIMYTCCRGLQLYFCNSFFSKLL